MDKKTTEFTPDDLASPLEWLETNNLFDFFNKCLVMREFWNLATETNHSNSSAIANLIAILYKANLLNYINGRDIVIFKDQLISFMSVIDIYKVINYFILKRSSYKALYECCDYNLVYPKQYRTLAIIADQINHLEDGKKSRIIIDNTSSNTPDYHGNGDKLKELNIDLIGFDKSLKMMYEELKKEEINET